MVTKPPPTMDGATGTAAYTIKSLGCGSAGTNSVAAVSGSTVGFASLALKLATSETCMIMPLGPIETSHVSLWDVCYAASDGGGNWTSQVVSTQPYLGPTGVGLAFDSAGNPSIAFTGVGSTPPTETCGSNDLFVTSMQAGTFGAPIQVSHGSASDALIASQAGDCSQAICSMGDATGFWPAIGFDPSGNAMMPFRDTHFGFAVDDYAKSDLELAEGSLGAYQVLTVDVSRGGGQYNHIGFTPAGLPAVLQYNEKGQSPGVYLNMQTKSGGFSAQEATGVWVANQISTGQIGQGLGFAISTKGLMAAAYYDQSSSRLVYKDSMDGMKWSVAAAIDTNGYFGFASPAIAFDSNGDPAVAYYRCNSQGPSVTSCDPSTDALLLARRSGTTWTRTIVSANANINDGMFPALAFVDGKAAIAYQTSSYDAIAKATTVGWSVAEGP